MAKKFAPLSTKAKEVLAVLKAEGKVLSLKELKEKVEGANVSHLNALKARGLVSAEKVEKVELVPVKREVNEYGFVADEAEVE